MPLGRSGYISSLSKEQLQTFLRLLECTFAEKDTIDTLRAQARQVVITEKNLNYNDMPIVPGTEALVDKYRPVADFTPNLRSLLDLNPPPSNPPPSSSAEGQSDIALLTELLSKMATSGQQSKLSSKTPVRAFLTAARENKIAFHGSSKESVILFLRRFEECLITYPLSDSEKRQAFTDLLEGPPATWYRVNKNQFSSWNEVVKAFKNIYIPPDHDQLLKTTLNNRHQDEHEFVIHFISAMRSMNECLTTPLPETEILNIILKNLHPSISTHVGLKSFTSLAELEIQCLAADRLVKLQKLHVPPSKEMMEDQLFGDPEVAQRFSKGVHPKISAISNASPSTSSCRACLVGSHRTSACPTAHRPFCFDCGSSGNTTNNCECKAASDRRMKKATAKQSSSVNDQVAKLTALVQQLSEKVDALSKQKEN